MFHFFPGCYVIAVHNFFRFEKIFPRGGFFYPSRHPHSVVLRRWCIAVKNFIEVVFLEDSVAWCTRYDKIKTTRILWCDICDKFLTSLQQSTLLPSQAVSSDATRISFLKWCKNCEVIWRAKQLAWDGGRFWQALLWEFFCLRHAKVKTFTSPDTKGA